MVFREVILGMLFLILFLKTLFSSFTTFGISSPQVLIQKVIDDRNGRVMAGYAWDWDKNLVDGELPNDVVIEDIDFAMPWNGPNCINRAIHPDRSGKLGCIHTVQGLELEYAA